MRATTDFARYFDAELIWVNEGNTVATLRQTDMLVRELSGMGGPLRSLRAEALERSGRKEEAWGVARDALEITREEMKEDGNARALFDLVVKRFARIARANGNEAEAASAERELAALKKSLR
jgi:hypothetical protein